MIADMAWTKPQYPKGEIDRAGKTLITTIPVSIEDLDHALTVINNFRSSHSYPLQALKMALRGRARRVDDRAIVAQRLKRLSSISVKLNRNQHMALSQMQDLGGCRAVLRTVGHVDKLVQLYEDAIAKNPTLRAEFVKKYDYILTPKKDGYRGIHLIYKYRSAAKHMLAWNGLRIEIQLRSRLQHAWATAVETVDMFTSQSLKTGGGADLWRRFFVLMGTSIAIAERRPPCPDCPQDPEELKKELRVAIRKLDVRSLLQGWSGALNYIAERLTKDMGVYLLHLDTSEQRIRVIGFPDNERAKASDEYLAIEKAIKDNPAAQAVLVSVESIRALRGAFPNYFADTSVFIRQMDRAIE